MTRIKNLTPAHLRCAITTFCPAVYEQEGGTLIIGKIVPVPEELAGRIGPDEALVWVPKGMVKPGDSE